MQGSSMTMLGSHGVLQTGFFSPVLCMRALQLKNRGIFFFVICHHFHAISAYSLANATLSLAKFILQISECGANYI